MIVDDCEDGGDGCPHLRAAFGWCAPSDYMVMDEDGRIVVVDPTPGQSFPGPPLDGPIVDLTDYILTRGGIRDDIPAWGQKQEI